MKPGPGMAIGMALLFCGGAAKANPPSPAVPVAVSAATAQEEAHAPPCKLSADDAWEKGIELLGDGLQSEAEKLMKSAAKTYPDDIRILFARGVLERSRWDKLTADFYFVLAMGKKGDEALSRAAWISTQLDRHRKVRENLDELIRLSDENPDDIYLLWLGAIQCREQSRDTSPLPRTERKRFARLGKERYQKLFTHFKLGPVMAHHTYANILTEDTGDYDEALEHRIKALSMEAKSWTLEGFADTLTRMKKYRWACAVWAQAVKKDGTDARFYNRWGDALYELGKYREAEDKYWEAIHLRPRKGSYWNDLANCLKKQGNRKEEMFKAYQRAVELGNEKAVGSLAWCHNYGHGVEKDKKKALQLYLRYYAKFPNDPWINLSLGGAYTGPDSVETNFVKGIQCYGKALKRYPRLHSRLAWCYAFGPDEVKDPQKALYHFEKALELYPTNTVLLCNFSAFLSNDDTPKAQQNFPRAAKLADRLLSQTEAVEFCGTAAQAYFKNGQYEKAVKSQQHKLELYQKKHPGNPVPDEMTETLEKYKKALEDSKEAP